MSHRTTLAPMTTRPNTALPLAATFLAFLSLVVLAAFDQTVVSTVLPGIQRDLRGTSDISWIFSAYLITSTVAVPLYGKLADQWGSKPALLAAASIFLAGSVFCGASGSATELVLARGLQGAGGGAFMTLAMTSVARLFDPPLRFRLQGLLGAAFSLSTMAGPVLGGILVQYGSWRWAFLFNVPAALLAIAVLSFTLPRTRAIRASGMDYRGALLLTASLVCIIVGTSRNVAMGVGRPGFVLAGIALASVFIWLQARTPNALLPLEPFRHPSYVAANVLSAASGIALFAIVVFMPLYFQSARMLTPTASGWHLMALTAGITLGSAAGGRSLAAAGRVRRLAITACGLIFASLVALAYGLASHRAPVFVLSACLAPLGAGLGILFPLVTVVAQRSVCPTLLGVATASPVMFRSVAGALGVSVLDAIFSGAMRHAGTAFPGIASKAVTFESALSVVLWVVAGVVLIAGLAAWRLPPQLIRQAPIRPTLGATAGMQVQE
ncbi:MFS transporter [Paraburkholderia sp. B3]|uniref:MFS transporter n=1 Tax=Paraburkholderia sp. B3 TaxID=3134791 RepID=UPI00398232D0